MCKDVMRKIKSLWFKNYNIMMELTKVKLKWRFRIAGKKSS